MGHHNLLLLLYLLFIIIIISTHVSFPYPVAVGKLRQIRLICGLCSQVGRAADIDRSVVAISVHSVCCTPR